MARIDDELLQVDRVVAEARPGLGAGGAVGGGQPFGGVDPAHALAAAAGRGLEHDRIADRLGERRGAFEVGERVLAAGDDRHPGGDHQAAALDLGAHGVDRLGRGSDEGDAGIAALAGEAGAFGEEPISGMDGVGPAAHREIDDGVPSQIALPRGRRPDAVRLIGEQHRQPQAVGLGIDRHGADPPLAAPADHPHRDLAPVGDEDLADLLVRLGHGSVAILSGLGGRRPTAESPGCRPPARGRRRGAGCRVRRRG